MKRIICSLLTVMAMLATPMVQAENVSVDQAKDAAAHFLQHKSRLTRVTANQLTLVHQWNNDQLGVASMYVFAAPEMGWIIMTATTAMDPVVAYSDDNEFDVQQIAPQMVWWMDGYNEMVCAVQNADAEKPLGDSQEWTKLINHSLTGTKAYSYLMTTKWDQGGPAGDDYNMYSPVIHDSVAPTGCVATALAQICFYYGFPKKPQGSVTYWNSRASERMRINFDTVPALNYSIMPNSISYGTTVERRREVSRLGFYVGMSVKMQFGPALSGSTDDNALSGMKTNMKYLGGTIVNRTSNNDLNFLNKVRNDLMNNRPVYMSGSSTGTGGAHAGGHAWVCDGYQEDNENMYHMNWGWGPYGGNAFFNLKANIMTISVYNFSSQQSAIVGLIPPQDSTDRQVGLVEVENVTELGLPYPNPATVDVVLPYSTREASELMVYNISGCLVKSQRVQAGEGEVTLRIDALPAGIYIYRMGNAYGKFIVR